VRCLALASCTLVLLAALPNPALASTPTADYQVTFDASWSAATHPTGFPPSPHFSPLIGATHDATVLLWEAGQTASSGIERMAERGQTGTLSSEILALGANADVLIPGGGINPSPGSVSVAFTASGSHPFVSLVSMLAPSPDWFVGVSAFHLKSNGDWIESATVDLFTYDAGSDRWIWTPFRRSRSRRSPRRPSTTECRWGPSPSRARTRGPRPPLSAPAESLRWARPWRC
jgi:hypothetical protein